MAKKKIVEKKKTNYPVLAIVAIVLAGVCIYVANALNIVNFDNVIESPAAVTTTTTTKSAGVIKIYEEITTTTAPAATGTGTIAPSVVTLEIKSWGYNPNAITLSKGSTATWTNKDSVVHTVTGAGFDSGDIASGGSWTHTFNSPGTYEYSCSYHPEFEGTVIIE